MPPLGGGRAALWLVIANGLVLTLTSYFILSFFVDQAVQVNMTRRHQELANWVSSEVDKLSLRVRATGMVFDGRAAFKDTAPYWAEIRENQLMPAILYMYWIPAEGQSDDLDDILYGDYAQAKAVLPHIKTVVYEQRKKNGDIPASGTLVHLSSVWPEQTTHLDLGGEWLRVRTTPFALVVPDDHQGGYAVTVFDTQRLMDFTIFGKDSDFQRLGIRDAQGIKILDIYPVALTTDPDPASAGGSDIEQSRHDLVYFSTPMTMDVVIAKDRQSMILGYIPNIILAFGLVITAFGGFYVFNNQRQSSVLTKVNRALALKNMEMNTQAAERERLNETLRATESEHRAIINAVTDVIFEVDRIGRLLFLNESWSRVMGYSIDESLGLVLFDWMDEGDQMKHRQGFESVLLGQTKTYDFTTRLRAASGPRRVEISYSLCREDDVGQSKIVGTITDIEDQHKAEDALHETEAKYRTIWEHAVTGIYQIDAHGKLLSANPSLARIFGYDDSDQMINLVFDGWEKLFLDRKYYQEVIETVTQDGRLENIEREVRRKGGDTIWVLESMRVVKDVDGQIQYYEGSMDNIDERKKADMALKEAMRESEMANRSKTEFLANMSHELRTPLNAIIGFSEIIKDEVFGPLGQNQYLDYARDIHDSGKNLLTIINTILDVAKIESGDRYLNEQLVDLQGLMANVVELARPRLEANHQHVELKTSSLIPKLLLEELAFKQIILNLLSNAIKFTPKDGHITLSLQPDPSGDVRMSISDTGVGMDEDEIVRVMAPFGQSSGSFARTSEGPGLGLTLVHSLIRLHGGAFELVSQKGIGTTASVIIPAARTRVT
jgi:PAS domain S-box-containing protein